ncbi:hypothetical protein JL720_12170 [Aureococcus anophagefferens]|nr:hypothetical protein JL720_12170 [Aureococcus anophagefferens]
MTTRPASEVSREYDCAICLSTPEGQVHQCRNGHLFCAECLTEHRNKHRGTQCPTCRVALPSEPIRNLVAENAIARRPTVCAFCSLNTTVGELRAHVGRCPKRKVPCVAAGDGCMWNGLVVGERAAHEKACTFAICRKMLEPLKCELAESKRECAALRSRLEVPLASIYPGGAIRVTGDGLWRMYSDEETFATAGWPSLALKGGKWYYEGFAAGAGDGCGDDERSACDGHRCKLWRVEFQDWLEDEDAKWEPGDVVGCLLDLDQGQIHFSVNGDYDEDEPAFVDVPVLRLLPVPDDEGRPRQGQLRARDFARFKPHGDDGPEVQGRPTATPSPTTAREYDLRMASSRRRSHAAAAAPPSECATTATTGASPARRAAFTAASMVSASSADPEAGGPRRRTSRERGAA